MISSASQVQRPQPSQPTVQSRQASPVAQAPETAQRCGTGCSDGFESAAITATPRPALTGAPSEVWSGLGSIDPWSSGSFSCDGGPSEPSEPEQDGPFGDLENDALLGAIREDSSDKRTLSYKNARHEMFSDIDNVDGVVTCVYTGREVETKGIPNSNDMNCEHTWPQSKGATGQAKSDLHHLFPTDSRSNSIRGNYEFGEVVDARWEQNGAKFGTDANGNLVFEPPDSHKGNVARAMFYFSSVYDKGISAEQEAAFREWNVLDPVDDVEIARNDAIEDVQNNRNVFIDNPELANRVDDF